MALAPAERLRASTGSTRGQQAAQTGLYLGKEAARSELAGRLIRSKRAVLGPSEATMPSLHAVLTLAHQRHSK